MRTLLLLLAIVVFASARVPSKMFRSKGAKLCTFCNSFVGGIELGIASEEKDLEALANTLCDTLCKKEPALDTICRGLIDNELESIVNWLLKNEDAQTVCKQLHLC
ncbi:unnamed protein product [Enterobius vermicularis]|uniref:Saposin B-type domain-containing protein n=1 Tax=Enterobius vermicularis TaxID=51028 RepID=A0A0N4V903_ENTVE|nr:unnamed protein product [Enterobius vermicularis]